MLVIIFVSIASFHSVVNGAIFKSDCFEVDFTARLNLTNGRRDNNLAASYDVPLESSKITSAACGNEMHAIFVNWLDNSNSGSMKLAFSVNNRQSKYRLSEISFHFPAAIINVQLQTLNLFYRGDILEREMCTISPDRSKKNYSLPLTNEYGNRFMGTLELTDLSFVADFPRCYADNATFWIIIVISLLVFVVLFAICLCAIRRERNESIEIRHPSERQLNCPDHCNGIAKDARFLTPIALATGADGSLYVGDFNLVRRITPDGKVFTVLQLSATQVSYQYYLTEQLE